MRNNPVFIAAPPRCGTSLMARVLHAHGFWIGRTKTKDGAENLDIKAVMKRIAKRIEYKNWNVPIPKNGRVIRFDADIEKILDKEKVKGDWLVKTSWTLVFNTSWHLAYPGARWLLLRRPLKDIVSSMKRHKTMGRLHSEYEMGMFAKALQRRQNTVFAMTKRAFFVNMNSFIDDKSYRLCLLRAIDVEPDDNVINSIVDVEKWNGALHRR